MIPPVRGVTSEGLRAAAKSRPPQRRRAQPRSRRRYALLVMGVIVAGLASRTYPRLFPPFLGKYPGDALWAAMVFLGVGLVLPARRTWFVATLSLGICLVVEMTKLSPNGWLADFRQTTLGHLVLGRVFMWQNFLAYTSGIGMAAVGERVADRATRADEESGPR